MKDSIRKFIPSFLISWYHFSLALLGAVIYGFPSRKLKVIGITGTNGKTTVVELTTRILEEVGHKVASISSIRFKIGDKEEPNTLKMTMPGRLKLQKFLKEAADEGCQYAVIEVTSEGILQHRHKFIDFDVAVFTNLTPEHIEAHGSFEDYRRAKGRLFSSLAKSRKIKKISIINLDDKNADYFLGFPADRKIGYGINNSDSDSVKATDVEVSSRMKFRVDGTLFNLKLRGLFNVYNALAAVSIGLSQRIDLETCRRALEKIEGISGRLEKVINEPFRVFVDYAHTPDALEKVYSALPRSSRKICVLGSCGGGRDKWKRPELGKIASNFCSQIILTNEDPYDEDPQQIVDQIESGVKEGLSVLKIITHTSPTEILTRLSCAQ